MTTDIVLLALAGFIGGVANSIAGGGSFVTFPALLLAGVPPVSANASNTFASCSGYLSGAYALRREIGRHAGQLPRYLLISAVGGLVGAWLLMRTPEELFREAIPWLLLFATVLFVAGGRLNAGFARLAAVHRHASTVGRLMSLLLLFGVCLYGGFFNAGLGIVVLSYLALAGHADINEMNGLKLLISSAVSLSAIGWFVFEGAIAWYQGSAVLLGTLAGGYYAAHVSRRLPQHRVRQVVIAVGCAITLYFFYDIYFSA